MNVLFCSQFYYPSVGGVQEVMRQIAERLVLMGHDVTVATTKLKGDIVTEWNGVKIRHFAVDGNLASGLVGDVAGYRDFVTRFQADAILIKAAQQWTFDALLPVLDQIRARKVFIPCGFSGLYDPLYKNYYQALPSYLKKFDELVFYAEDYRDIDFCRAAGLHSLSILANGASEVEFSSPDGADQLKISLGIEPNAFVFSTVGTITGVKGHQEVLEAFAQMETFGKSVALVLNGTFKDDIITLMPDIPQSQMARLKRHLIKVMSYIRREGFRAVIKLGVNIIRHRVCGVLGASGKVPHPLTVAAAVVNANKTSKKHVIIIDLARQDVIDLFRMTDLFVFASNIEYSPLVLFEANAAGTPFLTVPVGNAEEIVRMTEGGLLCPAPKDSLGYTRVDPHVLAAEMTKALANPTLLRKLGIKGKESWQQKYTWATIAKNYERVLRAPTKDGAHS